MTNGRDRQSVDLLGIGAGQAEIVDGNTAASPGLVL